MDKNNKINDYNLLYYFRFFLSIVILLLMFYPFFGDKLLILNGIFLYFSYFLCSLIIVMIAMLDFYEIKKNIKSKNKIVNSNIIFILSSSLIYIGLICGHYVFSPINGILYIVANTVFINFLLKTGTDVLDNLTIIDLIQRIMFYLSSLMLLMGNQPFENYKLPITITLVIMLNFITIFNIYIKMKNKYESRE